MSKVLIIDDSSVMIKIFQRYIQQSGLLVDEFLEAPNGMVGLEKVTANNIDLILYSWDTFSVPSMTGVDFVKVIRGSGQKGNIPIVMVIAEGCEAEVENSGANGYLTKPFTSDQLRSKLGNFLKVR